MIAGPRAISWETIGCLFRH